MQLKVQPLVAEGHLAASVLRSRHWKLEWKPETWLVHLNGGDDRYKVVDIREAIKNGAIATELKDDNFYAKIDEIAHSFSTTKHRYYVRCKAATGGGNDDGGGNDGGGTTEVATVEVAALF